MVLYKNLQLNNTYQAKTSFKYILLSSINNLKPINRSFSFYSNKSSTRLFLIKENLFTNFKLRLLNLNLKKLINYDKLSNTNNSKIRFLKTSTCLATISKTNQTSIENTSTRNKKLIDFSSLINYLFNKNFKFIKNNYSCSFKLNRFNYSYYYKSYTEYFKLKQNEFLKNFNSIYNRLSKKLNNLSLKKKNFKLNLKKKYFIYLSATSGLFTWDNYRITNDEIKNEVNEILTLFNLKNDSNSNQEENVLENFKIDFEASRSLETSDWKLIYDKKDLIIWRRTFVLNEEDENEQESKIVNQDLFEYKVLGRFNDITPIEFYQTQIDLEYRKEWDYLVISLDIMDKDTISNTELIKWIMRFPYPLNPREYIYVRRYCIDPKENLLILVSKSIPNCKIDLTKPTDEHNQMSKDNTTTVLNKHHNAFHNQAAHQSVRITKYKSNIIIIPHNDLDKPGFDYVIQYYDVNKAKIPKLAYKWMATSGLPDYIDKLHKATLKLKHKNETREKTENQKESDILQNYELFYLNKPEIIEEDESNKTTNDCLMSNNNNTEPEINQENLTIESDSRQIEDLITQPKSETSEIIITQPVNQENKTKEDFLKFYALIVLEKVNNDFFSEDEPHPIFFN